MAITAVDRPDGFLLSKEPIEIRLLTDQYVIDPGARWRIRINNFQPVPGATTTFTGSFWGDNFNDDLVFNWSDDLADGITILQTNLGYPNGVWLDLYVLPVLNNHPQFSKFFRASRSNAVSAVLIIESINPGTEYSVEVINSGFSTTQVLLTSGADFNVNDNLKLRLKIGASTSWLGRDSLQTDWQMFDLKPTEVLDRGELLVDVGDAVRSLLTMPVTTPTEYVTSGNALSARTVWIMAAEHDESNAASWQNTSQLVASFFVLQGGRKRLDWGQLYANQFTGSARRVISNLPRKRFVCAGHLELINFHALFDDEILKIRRWNVQDPFPDPNDAEIAIDGSVFRDIVKLDLSEYFTADYRRVDIYTGDDYSEEIVWLSYEILPGTDMGFSLCYYNAYGVMESIWCESERMVQVDHSRKEVLTRDVAFEEKLRLANRSYGRTLTPIVKASTRMVYGPNWVKNLDLLLAHQLWYVRVIDGNYVSIPCSLVPGSVNDNSANYEGDYSASVSFTLMLNEEEGWSDESGFGL
jgi:hypothetical protein